MFSCIPLGNAAIKLQNDGAEIERRELNCRQSCVRTLVDEPSVKTEAKKLLGDDHLSSLDKSAGQSLESGRQSPAEALTGRSYADATVDATQENQTREPSENGTATPTTSVERKEHQVPVKTDPGRVGHQGALKKALDCQVALRKALGKPSVGSTGGTGRLHQNNQRATLSAEEKCIAQFKRLGTVSCGYHTSRLAWTRLEWTMQVGGVMNHGSNSAAQKFASLKRVPSNIFKHHPVDVLAVDSVKAVDYQEGERRESSWLRWVTMAEASKRPKIVVESWDGNKLMDEHNGPTSKGHHKLWELVGYSTRVRRWKAERLNGSIQQERITVLRIRDDLDIDITVWSEESQQMGRPMSNMLRFRDIPRRAYVQQQDNGKLPQAGTDPMPPNVGDLIETDRGPRRLLADEYARGAGVLKEWIDENDRVKAKTATSTTCVNIWEAVSESIAKNMVRVERAKMDVTDSDWKACQFAPVASKGRKTKEANSANQRQETPKPTRARSDRPIWAAFAQARDFYLEHCWDPEHEERCEEIFSLHLGKETMPKTGYQRDKWQRPALSTGERAILLRRRREKEGHRVNKGKATEWSWRPADLSIGGVWYNRVESELRAAADKYENSEEIYQEGLRCMDRHRMNYTDTHPEPKQLQLLWWMFPEIHREGLRLGSSMNFLSEPAHQIHPNSEMDEEQVAVAGEFVDELIALDIVEESPPENPVVTTCPLFCLPKPYQPGQWRIIANCRDGGQNEVVGADPVILPRMNHILNHLYAGGWSAVVDASKMFYQFPTKKEERKYLGLVHPVTGKIYQYRGLPMGAGNSPAIAGKYSAALVRSLREKQPLIFGGKGRENCWRTGFDNGSTYDPKSGMGMVWEGCDGLPAALIWQYVDDYLLHAPTYEKLCEALTAFLDHTVDLGFLCHPGKLDPPCQDVKYIGYRVNTEGIPALKVPTAKQDKAAAMVEKMLDFHEAGKEVSALSLAVVAGTLESIVEATPRRIGRCYLRQMYGVLHGLHRNDSKLDRAPWLCQSPEGDGPDPDPPQWVGGMSDTAEQVRLSQGWVLHSDKYYRKVAITERMVTELRWWRGQLQSPHMCRSGYGAEGHILSPTWGDGSGTGTGGTIDVRGLEVIQWMGAWLPVALVCTSNWKELNTLKMTLEQLWQDPPRRKGVCGTTVFYFTDNEVTYYIGHSGSSKEPALHRLIMRIKDLEVKLNVHLEVVHVPGTSMIAQGTDGLSRGVWIGWGHSADPSRTYTKQVFEPCCLNRSIACWAGATCNTAIPTLGYWDAPWRAIDVLHRFTIWAPPPPVARQLISWLMDLWTESPLDTSFMLVVPRVMQRDWAYLSRYCQRIGCFPREDVPEDYIPGLPIPVVLLYCPPHQRALSNRRHKSTTNAPNGQWHREQAELLRGLS